MPRKLRVEYPGAIYHVINRGDRREDIFCTDSDREMFLKTLGETCEKTGWHVHAYCLMPNHFHLVVETPHPNLVAGMKWFLGTYTARFNRKNRLYGHLFSGRYKSLVVDGEPGYLRTVCMYVHLNPWRARLLKGEQRLRQFRWSSFPEYLKKPRQRWKWLRTDRLWGECGYRHDTVVNRRHFESEMQRICIEKEPADFKQIRRGWFFGTAEFKSLLLEEFGNKAGEQHYAQERREGAEEKGARIIAEELKKMRWTAKDLKVRKKSEAGKVRIALRLRGETTLSLKWVAKRLEMGRWTNVSNLLSQARNANNVKL